MPDYDTLARLVSHLLPYAREAILDELYAGGVCMGEELAIIREAEAAAQEGTR